jgi:hypothetical protein
MLIPAGFLWTLVFWLGSGIISFVAEHSKMFIFVAIFAGIYALSDR